MTQTAKLFMNGRSQAIRLPVNFRFKGEEVYIRRDEKTGNVILSDKPADWDDFFALLDSTNEVQDFLIDRQDQPAQIREIY